MGFQYLTNPILMLPEMPAVAAPIVPSGVAFTYSAYQTIGTMGATAGIAMQLTVKTADATCGWCDIEINVGAIGSEVPIATKKVYLATLGIDNEAMGGVSPFVIGLDRLPALTRVSARVRTQGVSVTPVSVKIAYIEAPVAGSYETTSTSVPFVLPAGSPGGVLLTVTVDWTWSPWVQLSAAFPYAAISGYTAHPVGQATHEDYQIQLGTGVVDSEVPISGPMNGNTDNGFGMPWFTPCFNPFIITGTPRLSVRVRMKNNGPGPHTFEVGIEAYPLPL